jgi:hypothetical protein
MALMTLAGSNFDVCSHRIGGEPMRGAWPDGYRVAFVLPP